MITPELIVNDFVHLFNGISDPYELLNVKNWFIRKFSFFYLNQNYFQ